MHVRDISISDTVHIRVVSTTDTMHIRDVFTTDVKDIQGLSTPGIVHRPTQEFSTTCIVHMFLQLISCIPVYMFLQKSLSVYVFLQHISTTDTMHIRDVTIKDTPYVRLVSVTYIVHIYIYIYIYIS